MTQDSSLSADKVAELEHKLADAAAQVAKVQAQLTAAQHTGQPSMAQPSMAQPSMAQPPPPTGAPESTIPPVPYAAGTSPHVITINGQEVVPGTGNMLQALQQLGKGGTAPVVMVNGQQVSGAQLVDIGSYLTPEVTQRIASSLQSLGLDHQFGGLFGAPPDPPQNPATMPLADPPRHVPAVLKLSTFSWSWWELFALIIGITAPIALFLFVPETFSLWMVVAVLVIGWFRVRRFRRLTLLKHGKVATVTNTEVLSTGTYYSGVTYQNMRVPQARGWRVTRSFYSGPSSNTKIDYSVDGASGSLVLRGLPYAQGVVLADPRKPQRAEVISAFPFSMAPGPDGQLTGELSIWQWFGVICTLVMESTLVALTALAVYQTWFS